MIGTNESHFACANNPQYLPKGMVLIQRTLHSHGKTSSTILNKTDLNLAHWLSAYQNTGKISRRFSQDNKMFSEQDFALPSPRYLAIPDGVLFQSGSQKSVRRL